ncbi:hypothetical protein B0I37DRAFT_394082 [Chaetomium sp. MPI-CAGE-AT-0009]|nr:hypothetical protein B0I37DRAFT_394082 [Chaetomium sp. MPI-CAGE-AT-0009]
MHLEPTPLPDALDHLLESTTRISALIRPAFGLAPPVSQHQSDSDSDSDRTAEDADNTPTSTTTTTSSREERGHRRVGRVRADLIRARSMLEQLRRTFCDTGRWGMDRRRRRLIEMRQVAAVVGAGAVALYRLEGALRELVRLYEVEEGIKRGGKEGKEGKERDVDVVRWMRHERRGEVWDLMKGVEDFWTGAEFVVTILEDVFDEETATALENLRTAVADILRKDDRLSREINRLYPGLNPRASRLETAGVSTILGSSLGRDTSGPSSDGLIPRPVRPSDNAAIVRDTDDSDASDSDSEPVILTPTSSEFPLSEPGEEESDPGYQLSLAPIINFGALRVPVAMSEEPYTRRIAAHRDSIDEHPPPIPPPIFNSSSLRVLTVSTSGVDISPLPEDIDTSLPQRTPNKALSADAVFQLPNITDQIVLDFFRRALVVSRFATQFANGKLPHTGSSGRPSAPKEQLEHLRPRQLRELCTDLYDELVRRNLEDQNKSRRESADEVQFVEPEGFSAKRRQARRKLFNLTDDSMAKFITLVLGELETRCGANMYDGSRAAECRAADALSLEGTPEEELRRKMPVWARDSI